MSEDTQIEIIRRIENSYNSKYAVDPIVRAYVQTKSGSLTPITHPTIPGMYKVVVMKQELPEVSYVMFVGDGYVRVFNDKTLPDDLRFRMLVIDSAAEGVNPYAVRYPSGYSDYRSKAPPVLNEVYNNTLGTSMESIGWRYFDYYCIVMSSEELNSYKGISSECNFVRDFVREDAFYSYEADRTRDKMGRIDLKIYRPIGE